MVLLTAQSEVIRVAQKADSRLYIKYRRMIGEVAWYAGNSGWETHHVGTKKPNELGIYDMSGNVSEMVSGWLGEYSDSPQTDPGESWGSWNRGIRGGNWADGWWKASNYTDENWYVLGARVWARGDDRPSPYYPSNRVGFRLARD
jgi:formylglycine-generating enzyme required for sulfatase activity